MKMCSVEQKQVFKDLSGEDPEPQVTEIESLCMECHANGTTRLLLTKIPYYKNVVIMSFSCEKCGYENNEIQPGGAYAELGVRWKLHVEDPSDLNRQVVKSDYTAIKIPEVDLEIPAQSQKGGNCFVENPDAPRKDARCDRTDFRRTKDQDHALGIFSHEEPINVPTAGAQAFPVDGIGRLGHDPPRGPSADWWVLTTTDAAGTNGLTCLPKHGGARDSKCLVTHPMTDHCESCLTSTIAAERANHLRHRAPGNINCQ
ncbi:hypothetical protein evm_013131 [Chilo suppressalis]|nr:hypothetical protein evm_013131 [Chilo suppressalis]